MKKPVLVVLALLFLIPLAQSLAQAPPVAAPAATPVQDAATARFLATLSGQQAQTPDVLTPAPDFMTGCNGNDQCPTGQICCFLCGNPPADPEDYASCYGCTIPYKGRCPMVV